MTAQTSTATATEQPIEQLAVNTIRTLAMDAVQAANSGHPGTPMALAPVGYTLWTRFLRFDPELPVWANRDRFVLSAGHASTLLYALLHLSGVKSVNADYETAGTPAVTLDDLKRFRQLDSKCPGHPEYRWTSGVECTTGPLGTGIATSVGMAIAGLWQAATFNRPGYELFDYDVYAVAGDGCLMEGIGAEAASLAGHLKLSNLCWDDARAGRRLTAAPRARRHTARRAGAPAGRGAPARLAVRQLPGLIGVRSQPRTGQWRHGASPRLGRRRHHRRRPDRPTGTA